MPDTKKKTLITTFLSTTFALIDRSKLNVLELKEDFIYHMEPNDEFYYVSDQYAEYKEGYIQGCYNFINMYRHTNLVRYRELIKYGINTPKIYYAQVLSNLFSILEPNTKYLLRAMHSARTLGQALITREDLITMTHNLDLSCEEFNTKFNLKFGDIRDNSEKCKLYDFLKSKDVYISKHITFKEEYRVLLFDTHKNSNLCDYIIESREGYGIDSTVDRKHWVVNIEDTLLNNAIINKLFSFLKEHHWPMASFDVYIQEDGSWGLFEYSTEFGVVYPDMYEKLSEYITKAYLRAIYNVDKGHGLYV